ncbi:hypothetical protein [Candidatus Uabimicrobium amorphum]|uniref:PEGA domain-containing protein n=1 Tax=Uabimicrobium amorphum TaxID=2596890 RepID=A0A5S9IMF9_UABAM|nr:hypothetical protein [Candidatus Uabimicrobium amorphum]BBM84041.1 hypothetical protein UABAM_02396 [Candidatus Uabimicrobium amorphum]
MNKKLSWLCIGMLIVTLIGCDCIRIKRLASEKHLREDRVNYIYSRDQEEPLEEFDEEEIYIHNEGDGKTVDITNEVGSNGGNIDRNIIDREPGEDGIGGSVLPGGGKVRLGRVRGATKTSSEKLDPSYTDVPKKGDKKTRTTTQRKPKSKTDTRIEWIIFTEYPIQEEITAPETVLLDGVEVQEGSKISSGSHQIMVKHPGHETLRETIFVPVGKKIYTFKGTMLTLPRRIEPNITYDISPPSGETSLILVNERSGKKIFVGDGTSVKPGEYQLKINRRGYSSISKSVRIYPLRSTYNITEMLQAKPVKIRTIVDYDVEPTAGLKNPSVVFLGRNIQQRIIDGGSIKPGRYSYKITQPGYRMQGNEKQIEISPGEEVHTIRGMMNVQPRQISFEIVKDDILVPLQGIFIDGERVRFDKAFVPGREYRLVVKFRDYQTVEKNITITPGEGPYRLDVPLIPK